MIITRQMLIEANACYDQEKLFVRRFGEKVRVTKDACLRYASTFDFDWAANNLLKGKQRGTYNRTTRAADRAMHEALQAAWEKYPASGWGYDAVAFKNGAARGRIFDKAHRAYNRVAALEFWKASRVKP